MRLKHAWIPDVPSIFDFGYKKSLRMKAASTVSVRHLLPQVWNQGSIGSCVGHAVSDAHYAAQVRAGDKTPMNPSRLFVYYNARLMQGWQDSDNGCYIRDAMKSVAKQGVANEKIWPYKVTKFSKKPPTSAYASGLSNQALAYERVDSSKIENIKAALSDGLPVVFGAMLYESFYDLKNGKVRMPTKGEKAIGGHAMILADATDSTQDCDTKNSWGKHWGNDGYHKMPYEYLTNKNLCDDFWVLKSVELT